MLLLFSFLWGFTGTLDAFFKPAAAIRKPAVSKSDDVTVVESSPAKSALAMRTPTISSPPKQGTLSEVG